MTTAFQLSGPTDKRPIRPLGVWSRRGWRLKAYAILYRSRPLDPRLREAAETAVWSVLPRADGAKVPGVGFVGVHQGRGFDQVFVDWWADENELHHRVFQAPTDRADKLRPAGPEWNTACVWDLRVMAHERDAWLETVLRNPKGPDLDAYLARQLDEMA